MRGASALAARLRRLTACTGRPCHSERQWLQLPAQASKCLFSSTPISAAGVIGTLVHQQHRGHGTAADAGGEKEAKNDAFSSKLLTSTESPWVATIMSHVQQGQADKALDLYHDLRRSGTEPDSRMFVAVLKACANKGALKDGKVIHGHILDRDFECDKFVGEALIDMYAKCGSMENARRVFDKLHVWKDVVWIELITGYIHHGDSQEALKLLGQMQEQGLEPNQQVLVRILQACSSVGALDQGKLIHDHIRRCGFETNLFIGSTLIHMYAKCGSLEDARRVFDTLPRVDLVTWTTIIAAYAQHGDGQEALMLLWQMLQGGMYPDKVALLSGLKACSVIAALDQGKLIHSYVMTSKFESNVFIGSILVDMYSKCGSLEDARIVFDSLSSARDLVIWNAMMSGFVSHGFDKEAVKLFQDMQQVGMQPNQVTLVSVLQACSRERGLEQGRLLHAQITERSLHSNAFVQSALIDMYCNCGSLENARSFFNTSPNKDKVSWNTMIGGYVQQGDGPGALQLVEQMQTGGIQPDRVTLISGLKACSILAACDHSKLIPAVVTLRALHGDPYLRSTLSDMYEECRTLEDTKGVLESFSTADACWNAIVAGCAQHNTGQDALNSERQHTSVQPNEARLGSLLKTFLAAAALKQGRLLHAQIRQRGYEFDVFTLSTLIDMYAKCGSLQDGRRVFDSYPTRDLVAWNAMIGGYVQQGAGQEAIQLFQQMLKECIEPDQVTLLSTLKACSTVAALDEGRQLHALIVEYGFELDSALDNSLIDMYAKCGSLSDALVVFDRMPSKDLVSWNVMIGAYAQHGEGQAAVRLFQQMQGQGMRPDNVTFVCLLSACSHTGLVEEGVSLFRTMCEDFCITPQMEHSVCIVDLLGRAGRLRDAERFVKELPTHLGVDVLTSLLGACRTHGNLELGRSTFEAILELDPFDSAAYVLMADMYAAAHRWEAEEEIRAKMQKAGVTKEPGRTWMEADKKVNIFTVEDKEHPHRRAIYAQLQTLLDMVATSPVAGACEQNRVT